LTEPCYNIVVILKTPILMTDAISWARRVNNRWIVRQSLKDSSNHYMDHLAETDPLRLEASCLRARRMTELANSDEDPKPWYYAGLFSLIEKTESPRYLAEHHFTSAAISNEVQVPTLANLSDATFGKIHRIREALKELQDTPNIIVEQRSSTGA
jgi:hypothetical protein